MDIKFIANSFVLTLILIIVSIPVNAQNSSYTDPRDGESYQIIKIFDPLKNETVTWMSENLRFKNESSYVYKEDDTYAKALGRLYTWKSAMNACPEGWHLPTNNEWGLLIDHFEGKTSAGEKLKSSSGWMNGNNGSNESEFNILPSGSRSENGKFDGLREEAFFWTSTDFTDKIGQSEFYNVWVYSFSYETDLVSNYPAQQLDFGFSVRCIEN